MYKPNYRITDLVASCIAEIERARGFLEGATLSSSWLEQQRERAFILEAHSTTHIEGTQLTLDQTERVLKGDDVPGARPDDVQEVLNYREAFTLVSTNPPISQALIREIHKKLVQNVRGGAAAPGEYRKVQNYVVNSITGETIYTPPEAYEVPGMMADLVSYLGTPGEIHPVLVAGIAQFQFVHIHPFLDGNGRTARLLATLCLYNAGYDFKHLFTLSEYYDRDRPAYYAAIQSVRKNGLDLTEWLDYFSLALRTQLDEVKAIARRAIDLEGLAAVHGLNDRQKRVLGVALTRDSITLQEVLEALPDSSRRSLQRDLNQLTTNGLLVREGAARRIHYRVP